MWKMCLEWFLRSSVSENEVERKMSEDAAKRLEKLVFASENNVEIRTPENAARMLISMRRVLVQSYREKNGGL